MDAGQTGQLGGKGTLHRDIMGRARARVNASPAGQGAFCHTDNAKTDMVFTQFYRLLDK